MKRTSIIGALIIALTTLFAQNSHAQVSLGIKAGYNNFTIANLDEQVGIQEVRPRHGIVGGAFLQLKASILVLQAEALYSQQGAEYTRDIGEGSVENEYLNIPLLAKIKVGPVNIHGGIQYGLLLSSTIDGVKDENFFFYKKTDMSLPLGVGVDIKNIVLEARYVIGLSDIDNTGLVGYANAGLQVTAGIKF